MKKAKRITAILLAVLMCCASMLSCAQTQNETGDITAPVSDESITAEAEEAGEESKYVDDDLGNIKFDGMTYTVLFRDEDEHKREITADEMTGDVINDALFNRTQSLEERFSMKLGLYPEKEGNLNQTFTKTVNAGDHAFNVAFQHMILTSGLAAAGVTMNWYDIPHLNFEKPWWTSSVNELTVNGIMFVTASDYCLNTFEMAWCLIFNKQMLLDLNIGQDPYALVREGAWTIDKYHELVKNVTLDSNGDGTLDDKDRYGINSYGSPWLASISNYWWACGETISRFDENGQPYFAMESEKTQTVFEKMYSLLNDDNISYWDKTSGTDMIFWKDQALFASMMVRDVEVNRDKDLSYGLVPYPKYDELQEKYLNLVDGHASMMAVPVTLSKEELDFTGAMVEAFSAAAFNEVIPAYYEVAMQVKFAQDENMSDMLELVRSGRVFNFGYVYDVAINRDILVNLITSRSQELSSKIKSAKKVTEKNYEKVAKGYKN